jgi:hypothetical protein
MVLKWSERMKFVLTLGVLLMVGGCWETPMTPAANTQRADPAATPSPVIPAAGTTGATPAENELNRTGTSDQNGGSSSASGSTGTAGGVNGR